MDAGTLERVLGHIHNWFERDRVKVTGCRVEGGSLPDGVLSGVPDGVWYRIEGSYLNDGLHVTGDPDLTDETFDGTVTVLAVPRPLLRVAGQVADWMSANAEARSKAMSSPYQSESFGGYSYSMRDLGDGSSGYTGGLNGWEAAFASDLNQWRRVS